MPIVKPLTKKYIVCVPSQVTSDPSLSLVDWSYITSKVVSLAGDFTASTYDLYGQAFPVLIVNKMAIAAATR